MFVTGWIAGAAAGGMDGLPVRKESRGLVAAMPPDAPPSPSTGTVTGASAADARAPTYVEMRNVLFHVHPHVALGIRSLRGTMRSLTSAPIFFDDPASFRIRIREAEVGISPSDLTALLNDYVFAYPGAPLRHLRVRLDGQELVQTGRLRTLNLPFETRSTLSITADGDLRIHAKRTRLLGVGVTRVMRVLGLRLERLVDLDGARGARVEGNDIILDVERALPPPAIEGRLIGVRIEGDELLQRFGPLPGDANLRDLPVPDPGARNYMFYKGGTLRFGKLVMLDADMQIVDLDPRDPFRFDISRYLVQLVPGYSRTLKDGGLEVFMQDIDDAGAGGGAPVRVRQ
jgi:hypothetical protein